MVKEGLVEHHERLLGSPEGGLQVEAVETEQDVKEVAAGSDDSGFLLLKLGAATA
jgi:hypothetical protein